MGGQALPEIVLPYAGPLTLFLGDEEFFVEIVPIDTYKCYRKINFYTQVFMYSTVHQKDFTCHLPYYFYEEFFIAQKSVNL